MKMLQRQSMMHFHILKKDGKILKQKSRIKKISIETLINKIEIENILMMK